MSTSDLPTTGNIDSAALSEAHDALAAGLPDPARLARLANEFFRETPAPPAVGGVSLPATRPPAFPAQPTGGKSGESPQASALPYQGIPQFAPANFPDVAAPAEAATTGLPTPGILGGISPGDFSNIPSYSFIEEARSLFAAAPTATLPTASTSTVKIPTETELGDLSNLLSGKTPNIPYSNPDLAAPAIPGAVTHADPRQDLSFGFLDNVRPLTPINVIPTLAPLSEDAGKAAGDLSSVPFDVNAIRRDFPILQEAA